MKIRTLFLTALLMLAVTTTARAGGYWITVEAPATGNRHPQIRDAFLVVRPYDCGTPANASVTATAEGIVDGKRRSIPLTVAAVSVGVYGVKETRLPRGTWVVSVTSTQNRSDGASCGKIIELGPDGAVPGDRLVCLCAECYPRRSAQGERSGSDAEKKLRVKTIYGKTAPGEIDAALARLTGRPSRTAKAAN